LELAELKLITASNIINLRTAHGLTQAELGAKLNYSDKTISKWERGEAIPDAYVLTQIAELFGVTVDDLLSSHSKWEAPPDETAGPEFTYSTDRIIGSASLNRSRPSGIVPMMFSLCVISCFSISIVRKPLILIQRRHARHLPV